MGISKKAFEAIKKALMAINPSGSELTVDVRNYICYDENNRPKECIEVNDLVHDTGYPILLLYRDAD